MANRLLNLLPTSLMFKKGVSTLSPLTAAFNRVNQKNLSPKLYEHITGIFNHDILQDPSGFHLLREKAIVDSDILVKEALSSHRKRKMVEIFDQLSNCLCKVADLAEFVRIGHPQQRFANAAEQASLTINAEVERLNTHKDLYLSLLNTIQNGDKFETTPIDDHVAKLFLFDFEQSGIHLDEESRKLVVQLNEYILHVGSYFMNGTTKSRAVTKSKLPEEIRHCFNLEGDHVVVTGLFGDSENELIREAAYRIFLFPDPQQESLLLELLNSRRRLANICGFESYSHRAVKGSIVDHPDVVWNFLNIINNKLKKLSAKDFDTMLKLKVNSNRFAKEIKPWDVPFYTSAFKQTKYSKSISAGLSYFSLGACMEGLNIIFKTLFNVQLDICETVNGEVWHQDVVKIGVTDSYTNTLLGYIYCDFFERQSKPHQDCHFTIQGGCRLSDGSYQVPIVVLLLSLPNPTSDTPSLLNPHMLDNLFHEMGHAMHSMLARTPYQHITGTRCSTDLAEVPSILMEYFASDPRVVKLFARHYKTLEPIPDDLLDNWLKSKKVFIASDTQLQVFYSALDQELHNSRPLQGKSNTTEVLAEIQNRYYNLGHIENTAWQLRFGHLVGYGAKYYSYLVSRAVAASIWRKLFLNDPLSSSAGEVYKNEVLSHGGGKPSKNIVENVLDCKVNAEVLADSVICEIEEFHSQNE